MKQRYGSGLTWGSAILALPLLLAAPALGAASLYPGKPFPTADRPHLDAGYRVQAGNAATLDAAATTLGLPTTGAQFQLWGGGATLTRPQLRLQASGWTGALRSANGDRSTVWDLQLGELALEQSYDQGPLLITAGAALDYAELHGTLQGPAGHNSVRAPLWGGGVTAGVRWPAKTALGFFVRSAYLWLQGSGDWRGTQAAALGNGQRFDLSGPSLLGQVELAF